VGERSLTAGPESFRHGRIKFSGTEIKRAADLTDEKLFLAHDWILLWPDTFCLERRRKGLGGA
jgi:hypothetical protein